MAPSRDLAALFDVKSESLDDVKPHLHSLALIPHSAVGALPAVDQKPSSAELDLGAILTGDFNNIKGLLTCSICDQLLYEPWTIACGHTYCYGCLTSWFEQNRSCPECRSRVRHMPAPAFVVKQIVDIFVRRAEIMPAEESVADHTQRRKEEREIVENDRNSAAGLFKGTFNNRLFQAIIYDEADRIHRCANCGHEFVPGMNCENCGASFDGEEEALQDDWSDDQDELDVLDEHDVLDEIEMEYEIEDELDEEERIEEEHNRRVRGFFDEIPMFGDMPLHAGHLAERLHRHRQHHNMHNQFNPNAHYPNAPHSIDEDDEDDEEADISYDEDAGSLEGFVVDEEEDEEMNDSTPARPMFRPRNSHDIVAISSDDEQEESAEDEDDTAPVQARRRHRNRRPAVMEEGDEEEEVVNGEMEATALPSRGRRARPTLESDESDGSASGAETESSSGVSIGRAQRRPARPILEDSDSEAERSEHNMDDYEGYSPLDHGDESADEDSREVTGYEGPGEYEDYESAPDQSGDDSDHTLRAEEDEEQSIQWDDEEEPESDGEDQAPASRMVAVPDPPRRRRPWEGPAPARRGTGHQGGVQMGSAQRPISMDSDSSDSEGEGEDESHDQDIEMSLSPSRSADTAESEDGEGLGVAQNVHGDDDQYSDASSEPPRQRRRLQRLDRSAEEYQEFGFGVRPVSNRTQFHSRPRFEPQAPRLGLSFDTRREPVLPSSRSHRRLRYSSNQPALELSNRAPRGWWETSSSSASLRAQNRHGMDYY